MSIQKEKGKEMNSKKKILERKQFESALREAVMEKTERKYPVQLILLQSEGARPEDKMEPALGIDIGLWNLMPKTNIQPLWEKYVATGDLEAVADFVYESFLEFKQLFDKNAAWIFCGPEEIKKHIGFSLMKTAEVPEGAVVQPFQDLSVVFGLQVQFAEKLCIFPITKKDMEEFGLTSLELFELAKANMVEMWPACIMNLEKMCEKPELDLYDVMSEEGRRLLKRRSTEYVLRTESGELGAGTILYPGLAEYIAAQMECSFFFLLAAKSEVMILPVKELPMNDTHELKQFVTNSLWKILLDDFKLSDSVYFYDKEKDEISMVV